MKKAAGMTGCFLCKKLLLYDFQQFHGAGLDTDAAGNALGSGILGLQDHDLHGAGLDTLAAADALLLVDHVNTGLGILGNGFVLAGTHALAALDADIGLCSIALCNDADAGKVFVKILIECFGAGLDTLQASHTLSVLFNSELLHKGILSFVIYLRFHYTC